MKILRISYPTLQEEELLDSVGPDGPEGYITRWKKTKCIWLKGTRRGIGRTQLDVEIDDDDVIALFNALIETYRERVPQLTRDLEECRTEVRDLLLRI